MTLKQVCSLLPLGQGKLESAEILTNDGWKYLGTGLPEGVDFHCMVLVNKSNVLLIGGLTLSMEYSSKTYFFNFESKLWQEGPDLKRPRYSQACGMVKKDKNSDEVNFLMLFT